MTATHGRSLQDSDFKIIEGEEVALNPDYLDGCYTFRHRNAKGKVTGYTNLGYDVCSERCSRYLEWITQFTGRTDIPIPGTTRRGTLEAYKLYKRLMNAIRAICDLYGGQCDADLTPQLKGLEGKRVEVVDMHGKTRRFRVGKSTGWLPIHLECHNSRSFGGLAADREYKSVRLTIPWLICHMNSY